MRSDTLEAMVVCLKLFFKLPRLIILAPSCVSAVRACKSLIQPTRIHVIWYNNPNSNLISHGSQKYWPFAFLNKYRLCASIEANNGMICNYNDGEL